MTSPNVHLVVYGNILQLADLNALNNLIELSTYSECSLGSILKLAQGK